MQSADVYAFVMVDGTTIAAIPDDGISIALNTIDALLASFVAGAGVEA